MKISIFIYGDVQLSLQKALYHYHEAASALLACGAKYSDRISYKPKRFDLESLEVQYARGLTADGQDT